MLIHNEIASYKLEVLFKAYDQDERPYLRMMASRENEAPYVFRFYPVDLEICPIMFGPEINRSFRVSVGSLLANISILLARLMKLHRINYGGSDDAETLCEMLLDLMKEDENHETA